MSLHSRRQLRVAVEGLLNSTYRPGEVVTHSPDCSHPADRCLAHAVLEAFDIEHGDSVCGDVTRIVRRWLIARQIPVP